MAVLLYKAVLVPRVAYASVVWWPKTEQVSVFKKLERLRGLMHGAVCGAMRTTHGAVPGNTLGSTPFAP